MTWLIHIYDMTHLWVTWLSPSIAREFVGSPPALCGKMTHSCDVTHSHIWHDSVWLCLATQLRRKPPCSVVKRLCDITYAHVWRDVLVRGMTRSDGWRDSFTCVTWLIHMCDVTHSYVWRDSFISVTWLIHMGDMTHSYVWHDVFIGVTWLLDMCDMTHSYLWHDSFICVT